MAETISTVGVDLVLEEVFPVAVFLLVVDLDEQFLVVQQEGLHLRGAQTRPGRVGSYKVSCLF